MPEGTLALNIQTLQSALEGIAGLQGDAPDGDATGTNLAGASGLASTSLGDQFGNLGQTITTQMSAAVDFDPSEGITAITGLYESLTSGAGAPPTDALDGFGSAITQVSSAVGGDFVTRIQQTLAAIQSISNGLPENRIGIVSVLLDQVLAVVGSIEGPEAEKIAAWISSLQELNRILTPLITQAQASGNPTDIALEVVQNTIGGVLDILGFKEVNSLLSFLDNFASRTVTTDATEALSAGFTAASGAYAKCLASTSAGFPSFRDDVIAAAETIQQLKAKLQPVIITINQVATASIFQPNALESFLREKMESALSVQVHEVQKIDDPFNALFDKIDEAVEAIDLSAVRDGVLEFFETTRETIESVDIPSVGDFLQEQIAPVEQAVNDLQSGVTSLLSQIEEFFDGLTAQFRTLAENVGEFGADGSFRYSFQDELDGALHTARNLVGGDPENPSTPSLAGTLGEFQTSIDAFIDSISQMLQPVQDTFNDVRDTAVSGITDFTAFLEGLNITDLMDQLEAKVQEIVDALVPVDFALVVDPVVAELEENSQKLRDIDTSSLDDMLRGALQMALDVVISVDFTAEISGPLHEGFETIKAVPQSAIDELQASYEEALSLLDDLSPSQLLEAMFASFDVINNAVGGFELSDLLGPLDDLHQQYLVDPVESLKPSTLLEPVTEAFEEFTSVFDEISGAELMSPLTSGLDELKVSVASLDITGWLDELIAAIDKVKQDIRDIRPSDVIQPLVADFDRLVSELDRFKPSVVFAPAAELAAPLLAMLESVQQELIDALHEAFQAPLRALERLQPEALTQEIQGGIDTAIAALNSINPSAAYNRLKGEYFDLKQSVDTIGDERLTEVVDLIDPEKQMGDLMTTYNNVVTALEGLKQNVALPDLDGLYTELQERLLGMLPPYARAILDPETFKRVMRLADPTRFLDELDQRFEAIKQKLIPITPADIAAELDATYASVLALVDEIDVTDALNQVKDLFNDIKGTIELVRIDFVADDIDNAISDVRAMVDALNPSLFFAPLDEIHAEVVEVVESTKPSVVLAGLGVILEQIQDIVESVDPRVVLGPPLDEAWDAVLGVLDGVDLAQLLSPVVDKLDEIEGEFNVSLRQVETAFDGMLSAANSALSGSGSSASAGVSI